MSSPSKGKPGGTIQNFEFPVQKVPNTVSNRGRLLKEAQTRIGMSLEWLMIYSNSLVSSLLKSPFKDGSRSSMHDTISAAFPGTEIN